MNIVYSALHVNAPSDVIIPCMECTSWSGKILGAIRLQMYKNIVLRLAKVLAVNAIQFTAISPKCVSLGLYQLVITIIT